MLVRFKLLTLHLCYRFVLRFNLKISTVAKRVNLGSGDKGHLVSTTLAWKTRLSKYMTRSDVGALFTFCLVLFRYDTSVQTAIDVLRWLRSWVTGFTFVNTETI